MRWAWSLLLLLGCTPRSALLRPPDPPPEAQSWVLAIAHDGQVELEAGLISTLPARALRVVGAKSALLADEVHAPATAEIAYFAEDLGTLRLSPGPIPSPSSGERTRQLSPPARSLYRASLGADAAGPWVNAPWDQSAISAASVAENAPCATLSAKSFDLEIMRGARWGVPLGDAQVLAEIGTDLFVLGTEGVVSRRALAFGEVTSSAFLDRRGRLWLGGHGKIWRSPLQSPLELEPIVDVDTSTSVNALTGDPDHPEEELYALTSSGSLARIQGSAVDVLYRAGEISRTGSHLVWLGPGHVIAGWPESADLIEVIGGQVRLVPAGSSGVTSLAVDASGALLVGHVRGEVERWVGSSRTNLGTPAVEDILALQPFHDGFLYANLYGYLGQYVPGYGFCAVDDHRPLVGSSVYRLVPFSPTQFFVLLNVHDGVQAASYAILTAE
ncbi:MAG: hypothetical protein U1E65_14040 [Myxococcota bacterium]